MIITREQRLELIRPRVEKNVLNVKKRKKNNDELYKIVMIGESGTGKTSLLLRFTDNVFKEVSLCTIGVDFKIKTIKIDKKPVKL